MYRTDPLEGYHQTCFNDGKPYKYRGVFGNKTLDVQKSQHFDFKVIIELKNMLHTRKVLAEFGIAKKSVHRRYLHGVENTIHPAFGWSIVIQDSSFLLLNAEGVLIERKIGQTFPSSYSFTFRCYVKKGGILILYDKSRNIFIDQILVQTETGTYQSVFAVHKTKSITTRINSLTKTMVFNASTSSNSLYFSDDFKTIYDHQPTGSFSHTNDLLIGLTKRIQCTHMCVLPLRFYMSLGDDTSKSLFNGIHLLTKVPTSRNEIIQSFDVSKQSIYLTNCREKNAPSTTSICVVDSKTSISTKISQDTWNTLLIFFSNESVSARLNNMIEFTLLHNSSMPLLVAFLTQEPSLMYVEIRGEHTMLDDFLYLPSLAGIQCQRLLQSRYFIFATVVYVLINVLLQHIVDKTKGPEEADN